MAGPDHTSSDLLVRDADVAMYRAKQAGGGRYEIFDKHLEISVTSQSGAGARAPFRGRQAAVCVPVSAHLSPRRAACSRGSNRSLSLRRADGSVENFGDLPSVAEDSGLSILLAREALDAACAQLRILSDRLPEQELIVTVNLTRRQLYHPDLIAHSDEGSRGQRR